MRLVIGSCLSYLKRSLGSGLRNVRGYRFFPVVSDAVTVMCAGVRVMSCVGFRNAV